ncbi:MAG: methyltransferase [Leucobacter sp.]
MNPELIDRLRDDLERADYRVARVSALLGATADAARQRGVFAPARQVLARREASPLATLVRVFLLGETVDAEELEAALSALGADGARELGLVAAEVRDPIAGRARYRAALSLNPVRLGGAAETDGETEEWWILSDLDDQLRRAPARPDHVMGVGGATRSLIAQAPAGTVATSLDLGTGCGIVALHLTRHTAESVVATDISERALTLARANARLGGVSDRIDFRHGDLFEPVAGERFDLILSNPPFVITPREVGAPVYEYRDGGRTGDELAADVVRRGPGQLTDGGTLLCLANWESPWGENGLERVRGWIAAARETTGPLAAWVIERDRVEPAQYAETWVRDGGARPGSPEFEALMENWIADFAARRVVAVGLGSVRVRRGDTDVVHCEQAPGPFVAEQAGTHVGVHVGELLQRAFEAGVEAAGMRDAEVLAARWVLDRAVVELREHTPGEEAPRAIALTIDRPIARRVVADPLLAAAVGACDGDLTLGQIADALATLLEVDVEAASEALVAGARELTWLGMLSPARR